MRAQNDLLRPSSALVLGFGAGAFRLLPVAALYLARPLAVSPAPLETGNFSPLDTERFTCFLLIVGKLVVRGLKCVGRERQAGQIARQLDLRREYVMQQQSLPRWK